MRTKLARKCSKRWMEYGCDCQRAHGHKGKHSCGRVHVLSHPKWDNKPRKLYYLTAR